MRLKQQYKKPAEIKTAWGVFLKLPAVLISAGCFHLVKTFQVEKSLRESKVF